MIKSLNVIKFEFLQYFLGKNRISVVLKCVNSGRTCKEIENQRCYNPTM